MSANDGNGTPNVCGRKIGSTMSAPRFVGRADRTTPPATAGEFGWYGWFGV
jgi:hypothetical protein